MKMLRYLLTVLMLSVLTGCDDEIGMVLDLSGDHQFFDRGFPSDLALTEDGHPDLSAFPQPLNATIWAYKDVVSKDIKGFSPAMPIYMRFSGDIPTEYLQLDSAPLSYKTITSPVQLVDIDPDSDERGRRFTIKVSFQEKADEYRPDGLLQILPVGRYLKENTTYAVIVTRDIALNYGEYLEPNKVLTALLNGVDPRSEDQSISEDVALKALDVYAPLKTQLAIDGINTDDVIGATVWTTGEPSKRLRSLIAAVDKWAAPQPSSSITYEGETDDYYILKSEWAIPELQKGLFPYVLPTDGGRIQYDDTGEPIIQHYRNAPFVITVPKKEMPQNGYPMVFYNHGTGGYATQVYERGVTLADGTETDEGSISSLAAVQGWAASSMGGHMGADHEDQEALINAFHDLLPALSLNIAAYNFMNPQAMRDNFFQMVAERILFRHLINSLEIDPSLCPELDQTKPIVFDTGTQVVTGQSLGSMVATAQAANDPNGYQGLGGSGAGSFGLGLVMHLSVLGDKPLGNNLEPLIFFTDEGDIVDDPFHPVWALGELALGQSNTSIQASK